MCDNIYGLLAIVAVAIAAVRLVEKVLPKAYVVIKWFGLLIIFSDTPPKEEHKAPEESHKAQNAVCDSSPPKQKRKRKPKPPSSDVEIPPSITAPLGTTPTSATIKSQLEPIPLEPTVKSKE